MGDEDDPSDLQALERFVVDNDDLLTLEAKIGRFNIFDALGIARAEIRHSNFLAWLLDPGESHGQGSLFLKAILMDLLKRAGEQGTPRALSPVQLDGVELQGVEVRREWRSIDLLITCKDPPFVVAVENKVDSGEHSGRLQRYEKIVREQFANLRPQFVFLTREGDPPEAASDAAWLPYSYADIHRVLKRSRDANATSIGHDVLAFLDHYLNLIGTRFMDDPTIDELCQKIYKNHRAALQLIWERVGSPASGLVGEIEQMIRSREDCNLINCTARNVLFAPMSWTSLLPPIGRRKSLDPRHWLVISVEVRPSRCFSRVGVWPTTDRELRKAVIERLIQDPKEFGLRTFLQEQGEHWRSIDGARTHGNRQLGRKRRPRGGRRRGEGAGICFAATVRPRRRARRPASDHRGVGGEAEGGGGVEGRWGGGPPGDP